MRANAAAENVLGTMGTIFWAGQVLPQVWKSWRAKNTEGLSHWLMFVWAIAAAFLGVFNITQNFNIPLILQPQLFGFLSLLSWSQCMYYGFKKPFKTALQSFLGAVIILGGFEAGMVLAIRPTVRRGNQAPATFFGVATSVLLVAGLIPQYYEIWKYGEVKGISLLFMTIDILGGIFSVLSLLFKEKFEVLGAVAYSAVVVFDSVVVIAALILNPRAERRRKRVLHLDLEDGTGSEDKKRESHVLSVDQHEWGSGAVEKVGNLAEGVENRREGVFANVESRRADDETLERGRDTHQMYVRKISMS